MDDGMNDLIEITLEDYDAFRAAVEAKRKAMEEEARGSRDLVKLFSLDSFNKTHRNLPVLFLAHQMTMLAELMKVIAKEGGLTLAVRNVADEIRMFPAPADA